MADKGKKPSGKQASLRYMTGDEIFVGADGSVAVAVGSVVAPKGPNLRSAIAYFDPSELADPQAIAASVRVLRSADTLEQAKERIKRSAATMINTIKVYDAEPEVWNEVLGQASIPENAHAFAAARRKEAKNWIHDLPKTVRHVEKSLSTLLLDRSKAMQEAHMQSFLKMGVDLGKAPKPEDLQHTIALIERSEHLFPPFIKRYLSVSDVPLMLRDGVNFDKNNPDSDVFYAVGPQNGILCNRDILEELEAADPERRYGAERVFARILIFALVLDDFPSATELGIETAEKRELITQEMNGPAQRYMPDYVRESDAKIAGDYSPIDVLAFMHYYLNVDHIDANEVRRTMPNAVAMYERFMVRAQEKLALLEERTGILPEALPIAALPMPKSRHRFNPLPFGDSSLERQLIDAVRPYVEDALQQELPFNQCKCRLILNDKVREGGYPIEITLRNANKEDRQYIVYSGTDDLALAIGLKKALQSHLLSHPAIEPLWMSRLQQQAHESMLPMDEVLPQGVPSAMKLVDHFRFFAAELTFTQKGRDGQEHEVKARVPLGIEYNPQNRATSAEALARMQMAEGRLKELAANGWWETVGEFTQAIKHLVKEEKRPMGWRVGHSMRLEHYGEEGAKTNLGIPASSLLGQSAKIASAHLRFEAGPKHPNHSWRLVLAIEVDGLKSGAPREVLYPTLNLHTADETAAQLRAIEAVESLVGNARAAAQKYPNLYWQRDEGDNLIFRDLRGQAPVAPDPQNFVHLHEDMAHFKTNFAVHEVASKRETKDGHIYVTIGIERGTVAEQDLVPFRSMNGQPIELQFMLKESEANRLPEFVERVGANFRSYINDAYGNRTKDEQGNTVRKTRQEFRTATIENLLFKAFDSERMHGECRTVAPTHVRYRGKTYQEGDVSHAARIERRESMPDAAWEPSAPLQSGARRI